MHVEDFTSILHQRGYTWGSGVPCSVFTPLVDELEADADMAYIAATDEGAATAIAAGLTAAGEKCFALMQNSGLCNAAGPVLSLLRVYGIPVPCFVSWRGKLGEYDEPQHKVMGEVTHELLSACFSALRVRSFMPQYFDEELTLMQQTSAWLFSRGDLERNTKTAPEEIVVDCGRRAPIPRGIMRPKCTREFALQSIVHALDSSGAAVISTTGKVSRELFELNDNPARFYMVGSMGCAAAMGLGVALGLPERKVVVLDGDGSLLMKLGTLATIGHYDAMNLTHIVLDNGCYESTGGQLSSSRNIDLSSIAKASGYVHADSINDVRLLRDLLPSYMAEPGPSLIRMVVKPGSRADLGRPSLSPEDNWARFTEWLQ